VLHPQKHWNVKSKNVFWTRENLS
jgi:hypothetical protein